MALRDGARNIHRLKRARETATRWSAEASQELLRLRFRELRGLFDDAETVADVHEAWGVVASKLNSQQEHWGMQVDAVICSDQLTKLRQQWQESSTRQLHAMMAECFSKTTPQTQTQQQQQVLQSPPAKSNFNSAMEEAMVQEAEAARAEASPKRKKTTAVAVAEQQTDVMSVPEAPIPASPPLHEEDTLSPELDTVAGSPMSPQPESPRLQEALATPVSQEAESTAAAVEEEEFPRQDEFIRALERRSQQLERLAQSHRQLHDVTQRLMEALVNRQGTAA